MHNSFTIHPGDDVQARMNSSGGPSFAERNLKDAAQMKQGMAPDRIRTPNQNFLAFSLITPKDHGGDESLGSVFKFRGAFATRELAEEHVLRIQANDGDFDVHVVPCFEWVRLGDSNADEVEYHRADGDHEIMRDILGRYYQQENNRILAMQKRIDVAKDFARRGETPDEVNEFFFDQMKANGVDLVKEIEENPDLDDATRAEALRQISHYYGDREQKTLVASVHPPKIVAPVQSLEPLEEGDE